jgi:phage I-like protein
MNQDARAEEFLGLAQNQDSRAAQELAMRQQAFTQEQADRVAQIERAREAQAAEARDIKDKAGKSGNVNALRAEVARLTALVEKLIGGGHFGSVRIAHRITDP